MEEKEVVFLQDDFEYEPPVVARLSEEEKNQGKWLKGISSSELEEKLNNKLKTLPEHPEPVFMNTVAKAQSICAKHGYDPIEAMVEMAIDENMIFPFRLACHKEIAKYTYSKAKPQDVNQKELDTEKVNPVNIVIMKYGQQQ